MVTPVCSSDSRWPAARSSVCWELPFLFYDRFFHVLWPKFLKLPFPLCPENDRSSKDILIIAHASASILSLLPTSKLGTFVFLIKAKERIKTCVVSSCRRSLETRAYFARYSKRHAIGQIWTGFHVVLGSNVITIRQRSFCMLNILKRTFNFYVFLDIFQILLLVYKENVSIRYDDRSSFDIYWNNAYTNIFKCRAFLWKLLSFVVKLLLIVYRSFLPFQ